MKLMSYIDKNNVKQKDVAKAIGFTKASLSAYVNYEDKFLSGRIQTLIDICDFLNCYPFEIISGFEKLENEINVLNLILEEDFNDINEIFDDKELTILKLILEGIYYDFEKNPKDFIKLKILDFKINNENCNNEVNIDELIKKINMLNTSHCYAICKKNVLFCKK